MIRSEDYIGFSEDDVVAVKSLIVDLLARLPAADLQQLQAEAAEAIRGADPEQKAQPGTTRAWVSRSRFLQQAIDRQAT
ncbi:hypothetical protein [Brevundimonas sp.]|uniref:hypothetical protein n=1 Tax=Brevundimonas sp. TaxID=1871086 RepID=UPI002899EBB7|nr:hypothetical protein [Brevundimonas sp.]